MSDDPRLAPPSGLGRQLLAALLVAGAVAACFAVVDRPAALWARGLPAGIVSASRAVSALGYSATYLIGFAMAYPLLRFRLRRPTAARQALFVFAAVAVSGLAADVAKVVAGRWRPIGLFAEKAHYGFTWFHVGYKHNSFPSGHATTAGALACALTLLFPRWRALWFAAAAAVAASRVLVGAHYPGDVVAGLWLGAVVTLVIGRSSWFHDAVGGPGCPSRCDTRV